MHPPRFVAGKIHYIKTWPFLFYSLRARVEVGSEVRLVMSVVFEALVAQSKLPARVPRCCLRISLTKVCHDYRKHRYNVLYDFCFRGTIGNKETLSVNGKILWITPAYSIFLHPLGQTLTHGSTIVCFTTARNSPSSQQGTCQRDFVQYAPTTITHKYLDLIYVDETMSLGGKCDCVERERVDLYGTPTAASYDRLRIVQLAPKTFPTHPRRGEGLIADPFEQQSKRIRFHGEQSPLRDGSPFEPYRRCRWPLGCLQRRAQPAVREMAGERATGRADEIRVF